MGGVLRRFYLLSILTSQDLGFAMEDMEIFGWKYLNGMEEMKRLRSSSFLLIGSFQYHGLRFLGTRRHAVILFFGGVSRIFYIL